VVITLDTDRAEPATANSDNLIAFPQRANSDRADRRIQPRHIPTAGENSDHAFFRAHATTLLISVCVICLGDTAETIRNTGALRRLCPSVKFCSGLFKLRRFLS